MVGGKVIEVCEVAGRPEVLFVDCGDRPYKKLETCAIYVEKNAASLRIEIGDSLWWQGRKAYWTPQAVRGKAIEQVRCGIDYDIPIPRVGYSGVKHPSRTKVEA